MVDVPAPGGPLPGYLAEPSRSDAPRPGVVVIMDGLGLSADIRAQADRLAAAGYLALAPDLYAQGPKVRCVTAALRASRTGVGPAYAAIDAARRLLADRTDCSGRVGIVGFCMGGGFALLAAPQLAFAAAAVNYGYVPKDIEARLAGGACPIVGSYGRRDPVLIGPHVPRLRAACAAAGVTHDIVEYPGVGHSFMNRIGSGPLPALLRVTGFGYDEQVATDAWRRILAFFDEHLRPASAG